MGNVLVVRSKLSLGAQASVILAFAAWLIGPLAIAGDMHWREGWIYYVALGLGLLAHGMSVRRRNPEFWRARREIGAGTPSWDLVWNAVFWWLMAGAPLLAAFEHRKHAGLLPPWTLALGALLLWGGLAVSALAMAHNVFFEGTVRLQKERGQRVIDTGPYARVRHPGYMGLCLWAAGTPLLLRSSWALPVGAVIIAWVAFRTALEDRLLRSGLEGYETYARRVRWRLLPGLW
jgi:protein-S-isoprenylcysteine O-methyltransferase Ste14